MLKGIAVIACFMLLTLPGSSQHTSYFVGGISPSQNANIWDISEDERYALMTMPGFDGIIVCDLYDMSYKAISFRDSKAAQGQVRDVRFYSDNNKVLLCIENNYGQSWFELELRYEENKIITQPLLLPSAKLYYRLKVFKDVLIFDVHEREDAVRVIGLWVIDKQNFQPVKAISRAVKRIISHSERVDYLVDETDNVVYVLGQNRGSDQAITTVAGIQKRGKKWSVTTKNEMRFFHSATFNNWLQYTYPGEPEYYLTNDRKKILAISYASLISRSTSQAIDTVGALASLDLVSNKAAINYYSNGKAHEKVEEQVSDLGGIQLNVIRQGYSPGNGYYYRRSLENYLLKDTFNTVVANRKEVISKPKASFSDSHARLVDYVNNGNTILFKTRDNKDVDSMFLLDCRTGTEFYLDFAKYTPNNSYFSGSDFSKYDSYKAIKGSAFDIIPQKKEMFTSRLRANLCDQKIQWGYDTSLVVSSDDLAIDSMRVDCRSNNLIFSARKKFYTISLDSLFYQMGDQMVKQAGRFSIYPREQLEIRAFQFPLVHFVYYSKKSRCAFLTWDVSRNMITALYAFKNSGYPITLNKNRQDSVAFYYDIAQEFKVIPTWNDTIITNVVELYKYTLDNGKLTLLDTLHFKDQLSEGLCYRGGAEYYADAGLAVAWIPELNKRNVIVYDMQLQKRGGIIESDGDLSYHRKEPIKAVYSFIDYWRKNRQHSTVSTINPALLSRIFKNEYGNTAFQVNFGEGTINVVTKTDIFNLGFSPDTVLMVNELSHSGANEIDLGKNRLVTAGSLDQTFYVYKINPASLLFTVKFEEEKIRFETTQDEYAEFYTRQNQEKSAADYYLNRPDVIYAMLNNNENTTNDLYARMVALRRSKAEKQNISMGQGEDKVRTTVRILTDKKLQKVYRNQHSLSMSFTLKDTTWPVKGYGIWVNGVSITGSAFLPFTGGKPSFPVKTPEIPLSVGFNNIEIAACNGANQWSAKTKYTCYYIPEEKPASKLYFIGVAMSQYKDTSKYLYASDKDIRNIATKLSSGATEVVQVDTLINTRTGLKSAFRQLKEKLLTTGINDKVILMMSGHGLLADNKLTWNFASYETDFAQPDTSTSITYDDINWLFDAIPARNRLIMIDACHAGQSYFEYATDSSFESRLFQPGDALSKGGGNNENDSLGIDLLDGFSEFIPAENFLPIDYEAFKWMTEALPDYIENGSTIITASRGEQTAKEDKNQGVFTGALLSVLNSHPRGTVTVNALISAVNRLFIESEGQKPSVKAFNPTTDWLVW
ncbi:Caspase domain-containing protein [Filimonas lacunae]|uniref:Caspase domain-containing protein n=1 Tax=Filimonas lacunae TaxID=477680 RepID=A0A173MJ84_9BACT|nr:caspase family protein [Filimonas lacunae]BAV07702.1 WD-40 repeat protein [Filimonas lacunae]SIT03733.1 Caspase domain-containing protein [Filimonas lacunae]